MRTLNLTAVIMAAGLVSFHSIALAQNPGKGGGGGADKAAAATAAPSSVQPGAGKAATKPLGGRAPQRIIDMETMEIWGKIQKPHVMYVIDRGELKVKELPMERNMVRELEETVKGPPF